MQQTPVRYYIVKGGDQAVVRSVPVTVPPKDDAAERIAPVTAPLASQPEARREPSQAKTRVGRLMQAAARRTPSAR